MPIVNLNLTDDEAARVDAIAKNEKRARQRQCERLVMDAVESYESALLNGSSAEQIPTLEKP